MRALVLLRRWRRWDPERLRPSRVGLVTAAHLLTQRTKGNDVKRYSVKRYLTRMLYERNWDKQRIVDLFNIIDWMMQLPSSLQAQLVSPRWLHCS